MKRYFAILLVVAIACSALLSGCAATSQAAKSAPVKTGFAVSTSSSKSKDTTADMNGSAQVDIVMVAVAVDDGGVISDCVIDTVQSKVEFTQAGVIATDLAKEFPSKNVLADTYGMKAVSSIGKEWYEQAAALAAYVQGKTLEQVLAIELDENGKATDVDLVSSATISIGGYIQAIEAAVNNASHLGAAKGDALKLTSVTGIAKSKDAASDADGLAQTYTTMAVTTLTGAGVISSCFIDAVQVDVHFNAQGMLTSDLSASAATKQMLGDAYGMKAVSSIGKEWYEQANAFAQYATGKTVEEVVSIPVEKGKAVDLVSSVTVGVSDFVACIGMVK